MLDFMDEQFRDTEGEVADGADVAGDAQPQQDLIDLLDPSVEP